MYYVILLSYLLESKFMSNIINFTPKRRPVTQECFYNNKNPVYFSLEDDSFIYMRFGKVSIIQGKDSFVKRLTIVKL